MNLERLRTRTGAKWSHYPADVIPAWVADMDFEVATPILEAIRGRLDHADLGYPVAVGRSGLAELFQTRVRQRFGWDIEVSQVEFFNDVVQGLYLALLGLSRPGGGAVIQTPIYPPFLHAVEETGRRALLCPLVAGAGRFEIDFDALRSRVDRDAEVLMFCNPHNPCGRAFTRDELEQLAEFVLARGLYVVADEIHADLVLEARVHVPLASLGPEIAARTLTLMSPSKAFNIAGLRMAFGVCGSADVRTRIAALPAHVRGGLNTLSMAAVTAAWTAGQPWLDRVLADLRANRECVAEHVRHWPLVRHFPPEATYLAWLDCRRLALPGGPYLFFLERARVALSDGALFGEPGRGFVRLNFATGRELLEEILGRMSRALSA